jgi:hypothetical protein
LDGVAARELPHLEFRSDAVLLDLKGGGDRGWPGEMLLLDPNGRLVVRSETALLQQERPVAAGPAFADELRRLEAVYNADLPGQTTGLEPPHKAPPRSFPPLGKPRKGG